MSNLYRDFKSALQVVVLTAFFTIEWSCSTSNQTYSDKENSNKLNDSVLVDKDGNKYPIKILRDNKLWMTANLKLTIPDSYCYNDTIQYCERYGRLYTWESAQKGCALLGEGWQLPTKDEWQVLAGSYGSDAKDSNEVKGIAFQKLLRIGSSEFNAVLGGGRNPDGGYARIGGHGFYWTLTEHNADMAWFANFAKGRQALFHQPEGEKVRAFSVRCVKSTIGK